jgi:hypothetical protein
MNRNRKRCDCNAKTETANAFEPARNHDEKIDEILDEVKERLKIYECELANMAEWISETFGSPLNQKAIALLERAEKEMKRLTPSQ